MAKLSTKGLSTDVLDCIILVEPSCLWLLYTKFFCTILQDKKMIFEDFYYVTKRTRGDLLGHSLVKQHLHMFLQNLYYL